MRKSLKPLSILALSLLTLTGMNAQVEMKKEVKGKVAGGPKKMFYKAPKVVKIESISVKHMTSSWVAQGDVTSGVGIAGYLTLDSTMIQEISDETYAYIEEKLVENGYEVSTYDVDKLKATKAYPKAAKKGLIIGDGGIWGDTPKRASKGDSYIVANANGVVTLYQPGVAPMGPGKIKYEVNSGVDQTTFTFDCTIGFTKNKAGLAAGGGIGTNAVKMEPQLGMTGGLGFNYTKGNKFAMYYATNPGITYSDESWIGEFKEQKEMYGSSLHYTADVVKYKEAVLDMIKHYVDLAIADYIATCTPEK